MLDLPLKKNLAEKIKGFDQDDIKSLADMVRREVAHTTEELSSRLKSAEARVLAFGDDASHDLRLRGAKAIERVREKPAASGLVVAGLGLLIAGLIVSKSAER